MSRFVNTIGGIHIVSLKTMPTIYGEISAGKYFLETTQFFKIKMLSIKCMGGGTIWSYNACAYVCVVQAKLCGKLHRHCPCHNAPPLWGCIWLQGYEKVKSSPYVVNGYNLAKQWAKCTGVARAAVHQLGGDDYCRARLWIRPCLRNDTHRKL